MLNSIILGYTNSQNDDDGAAFQMLFWFALPFLFAGYHWIKAKKMNHDWEHGIFNNALPLSRDNYLEAHIYLAAQLIANDRSDVSEKIKFISSYFRKHFKASDYDFRATLTAAYRNPNQINAVSSWLNSKVKKKHQRTQIIYFLTGLSMVDGRINPSELKLLETIAFSIKITAKEFQSIIGMYQSYERSSRQSSRERVKSKTRTQSQKSISCKILGVNENSSFEVIKKAYRKMVKIHHPDRFYNESIEQQDIAKEKFIKIQGAYEYLEMYYAA